MGSPPGESHRRPDEGPRHRVAVDGFWMGKHEVTWHEFEQFTLQPEIAKRPADGGADPSLLDAITRPSNPSWHFQSLPPTHPESPAAGITQYAAKMYCRWLTKVTGRYYRLPTEAEWEYACRGGSQTRYHFGDDPRELAEYAWYAANAEDVPLGEAGYRKVGKKRANPFGLHDMHGNVAEWVVDGYAEDAYRGRQGQKIRNPLRLAESLYPRVVRGGSWQDDVHALRSAARRSSHASWKGPDPYFPPSVWYHRAAPFVGFRVLRPHQPPSDQERARYQDDAFQRGPDPPPSE